MWSKREVVNYAVCARRGWTHMIHSYLLGDGLTRRLPRRQQTVEDTYG